MSINVNVNGNPVSITRGRFVTTCEDLVSKEFQKRRRIRLEQVRQQSKNIAETVRNKVRKEKSKQLTEFERKGEKELKKWQARKLLALQQQYCECLKDIGLGHDQAVVEEEYDNVISARKEVNDQIAQERGDQAIKKLREKNSEEQFRKKDQLETKSYTRAVENTRAILVSDLNKEKIPFKRKKKNVSADINILSKLISSSESETESPRLLHVSCSSSGSLTNIPNSPISNLIEVPCPVDTRISDRIRRRNIKTTNFDFDICDKPKQVDSVVLKQETELEHKPEPELRPQPELNLNELPIKPTMMLRSLESSSNKIQSQPSTSNLNKAQYYDHKNRFTKEYVPDTLSVHKIDDDSIEVCPSNGSEAEFVEKMFKHDRDAQERGRRALEKEKVHRDYREMMKQLPKLQRQERIATISMQKPAFHMSESRLKEQERKKQNQLENAYEKFAPKPQIITIPSKACPKKNLDTSPFRIVDVKESARAANLGTWNFDKTVESESNEIEEPSAQRQKTLEKMLKSLTYHRDKLTKEMSSLPENSNLHQLFGDLADINKLIESGHSLDKESISLNARKKQPVANKKSKVIQSRRKTETIKESQHAAQSKIPKFRNQGTTTIPEPPPPAKTASPPRDPKTSSTQQKKTEKDTNKSESKVKKTPVLQTISTQTMPSLEKVKVKKVEVATEPMKLEQKQTANKALQVCECCTQQKKESACEIIIKISDDGKHRVDLKPENLTKEVIKVDNVDTGQQRTCNKLVKTKEVLNVKKDTKLGTSWREYLSQNSTNSSTSYYSPPEVIRTYYEYNSESISKPKGYLTNILKDKPQQGNVLNVSPVPSITASNQHLLMYIKKLLTMSRGSIEELAVSSVSEISTPGSSIINIQSNVQGLMKQYNVNVSDIEQYLNYSAVSSSGHCNTVENLSVEVPEARSSSLDEYATENYPGVLLAYNKMAESCAKKIEDLAAMIEKVRLEKLNILEQSPGNTSDKENSTKYLELPSQTKTNEERTISPDSLDEQEELNRQLLEIDYNFAEKLKNMSASEVQKLYPLEPQNSDEELLLRFKKLLGKDLADIKEPEKYEPLLIDIPRLPIFEPSKPANHSNNGRSKPPPSRGLSIAGRFNNIDVMPHELSTIVETDSIASSNQPQHSKTLDNRASTKNSKDAKKRATENLPSVIVLPETQDNSNLKSSSSSSLPELLESAKENKQFVSGSSASDLENMESMLKDLGMGWAVATLRKTQEALAISSSSSSADLDVKKNGGGLRTTLEKQKQCKVNSSDSKTEDSTNTPSSFAQDLFFDMSSIQGSSSNDNKTTRHTSTPIPSTRTTDKSITDSQPQLIMPIDSDLSSVKTNSCDWVNFYSLKEESSIKDKD